MRTSPNKLPSLISLHTSILAAMGLAACGGQVLTGTGGGTSGGTGGGVGGSIATNVCDGAVSVKAADGTPSGFARCPDGTVHRVEPVTCNVDIEVKACAGTEVNIACMSDADCTLKPHGRCSSVAVSDFSGPTTYCSCVYPCANDAECDQGQVCVCAGVAQDHPVSFCAGAACTSGAGCDSGECGLSVYPNGCYTDVELACRNGGDACRTNADCSTMPGNVCVLNGSPTAPWGCAGTSCAIGRPLVVDGEIRTAAPMERSDWLAAGIAPATAGLDAEARADIAAHWLVVGALEHASVASFSRFALELLALGAPASLLAEAQRSALDEIEHARVAYAIASAYAGRKLGPDALDLSRVTVQRDVREVVRALIVEGCVGETLGVAEAIELAGQVRDPALQRAHAAIAADEQRHAELAWRTLAWICAREGRDLVRFAAACFEEAVAAMRRDPEPAARVLPEHGLLSSAQIGAVRRRALAEVVEPSLAALLDRPRASFDRAAAASA